MIHYHSILAPPATPRWVFTIAMFFLLLATIVSSQQSFTVNSFDLIIVDCNVNEVVVNSSTSYVLANCTAANHGYGTIKFTPSLWEHYNVSVTAYNTSRLPYVELGIVTLYNCSIVVYNIFRNSSEPLIVDPIAWLRGASLRDVSVRVINSTFGSMIIGAVVTVRALPTHAVSNVTVEFIVSSLQVNSVGTTCGSLVVYYVQYDNATGLVNGTTAGVSILVDRTTINSTMYLNGFRNVMICLVMRSETSLDTAVNLQHSNISHAIACNKENPNDCVTDTPAVTPSFANLIVNVLAYTLDGMIFVSNRSNLRCDNPSLWSLNERLTVRSAGFVIDFDNERAPAVTYFSGVQVTIERTNANFIARQSAYLVYIVDAKTLDGLVARIADTYVMSTVHGAIRLTDGARFASVMTVETLVKRNISIYVVRTFLNASLVSGEVTLSVALNSTVAIVASGIIIVVGFGSDINVTVQDSVAVTSITGGYATNLFGLPMSVFTTINCVVSLSYSSNVEGIPVDFSDENVNIMVRITNSSIIASTGFRTTGTVFYGALLAGVGMLAMSVAARNATMIVENCTVRKANMKFDIDPIVLANIGTQIVSMNITGAFVTSDAKPFLLEVLPPAFLTQPTFAHFLGSSPPSLTNVYMRISGLCLQSVIPVEQEQRAVTAIAMLPNPIINSRMDLITSANCSRIIPVAMCAIGTSNISNSIFTIAPSPSTSQASSSTAAVPLSGIMTCSFGMVVLNHSHVNVLPGIQAIVVPQHVTTPYNANVVVSGGGSLQGSQSVIHTLKGSTWSIAGARFRNFHSIMEDTCIDFGNADFSSPTTGTMQTSMVAAHAAYITIGCSEFNSKRLVPGNMGIAAIGVVSFPKSSFLVNGTEVCIDGANSFTVTAVQADDEAASDVGVWKGEGENTAGAVAIGALIVSQISGGHGGASSVMAAFVLSRLRYMCSLPDDAVVTCSPIDSPLMISFSSLPQQVRCAVGTVVGNVILVVGLAVLAHAGWLACKRYSASIPTAFHYILEFLCGQLPGSLAVPFSILAMPTMAASVTVTGGAGDALVVLGVVGILGCVGLPMFVVWAVLWASRPFPLVPKHTRSQLHVRRRSWMVKLFHTLTQPAHLWVAPKGTLNLRHPNNRQVACRRLERLRPFFEGYREGCHWYFLVDYSVMLITSSFLGVAMSDCSTVTWVGWVTVSISCGVFMGLIALRPLVVPLDNIVTILVSALSVTSEIATMLATDDNDDVGATIALVAAVLQFAPVLVTVGEWRWKRPLSAVRVPSIGLPTFLSGLALGGRQQYDQQTMLKYLIENICTVPPTRRVVRTMVNHRRASATPPRKQHPAPSSHVN